jgi:hypothetical protein
MTLLSIPDELSIDDLPINDDDIKCPLTLCLIKDPVLMSDGFIYERYAMIEHLKHSDISPLTREKFEIVDSDSESNIQYVMINSDIITEIIVKYNLKHNKEMDQIDTIICYYLENKMINELNIFCNNYNIENNFNVMSSIVEYYLKHHLVDELIKYAMKHDISKCIISNVNISSNIISNLLIESELESFVSFLFLNYNKIFINKHNILPYIMENILFMNKYINSESFIKMINENKELLTKCINVKNEMYLIHYICIYNISLENLDKIINMYKTDNISISMTSKNNYKAIHFVCMNQIDEIVKYFVNLHVNLEDKTLDGQYPINLLCTNYNVSDDTIIYFLNKINKNNFYNNTIILELACKYRSDKLISHLLRVLQFKDINNKKIKSFILKNDNVKDKNIMYSYYDL